MPHPFPETREKVITDFIYRIRRDYFDPGPIPSMIRFIHRIARLVRRATWLQAPERDVYERILPRLARGDPSFYVGKVYRVHNRRHEIPYPHHFVLEIMDDQEQCRGHAVVGADGRLMGIRLGEIPLDTGPSLSRETAAGLLEKAGILHSGKEKLNMERLGFHALAAYPWQFTWRIRCDVSEEYFLQDSPLERRLYKVRSRRRWRLDEKSNDDMAALNRSLPPGDKLILDSINDQVLLVTPMDIDLEEILSAMRTGN